jgi:hypothetical protein
MNTTTKQNTGSRISLVKKYVESGLSIIPIEPDGSKAPLKVASGRSIKWESYQHSRPSNAELRGWYATGHRYGIAIIAGAVSGNLEILDFDDTAIIPAWREMVENAAPGLLDQLPQVQTPTGGLHVFYRCESIGSNNKLAERISADGKIKPLIETRGEGGYVVTVGSPPECHPTSKPYLIIKGELTNIPTITLTERTVLIECAKFFNEHIKTLKTIAPEQGPLAATTLRPGDDFNQRGDVRALLERYGWKHCGKSTIGERWQRPNADRPSATLFNDSGLFYVFSTSAHPFESDSVYTPFAVYSLLEHAGDYHSAAQALGREGYGKHASKTQRNISQSDNSSEIQEWDPPAPFYEFDLPEFPVQALPSFIRSFVESLATATQTPVDLAALMVLAVCAAAVARNVRIEARPGWEEPLNIFVVIALPPANRKSGVFEEATRPLLEFERDMISNERERIAAEQSEHRVLENELAELEKKCAKQPELKEEAKAKARELAGRQIPALPKLVVADVTSEVLATFLSEQKGRMALFSVEGGIFETMAGRYANGVSNIDVYLKGHSGDDLRVDRRERSEHIAKPALTIGLAVQPEVLRGLIEKPGFRGRGLLGRFQYSLPKSTLGRRKIRPTPLSIEARSTYLKNILRLAAIEPFTDYDGDGQPRLIRLSHEADDYLAAFEEEIEPMLAEDGELAFIGDWAGKLAGAVVRIAGILHLGQHAESINQKWMGEVSADTLKKAITIARYLIPHARAAYAEMGADPKIAAAKFVLRWIEKSGGTDFTRRQAFEGTKSRFKEVAALDPALRVLEDHGYIRLEETPIEKRPGRRPSEKYLVNPIFQRSGQANKNTLSNSSHNSHNSHN